jgi:hypothetical protein
MTLDVKKSNSSNETPNKMTVGVEKYGLKDGKPDFLRVYHWTHIISQAAVHSLPLY